MKTGINLCAGCSKCPPTSGARQSHISIPSGASPPAADCERNASPAAIRERRAAYSAGWIRGDAADYDPELCLDLAQRATFLHATQPEIAAARAIPSTPCLKTDYLWREIFNRESMSGIIERYAPNAAQTGSKKTDTRRGKQEYKRNRRRKRQEGAKHRFTDEQKEQAVKMRAEGMSLSAAARAVGASVPTASKRVKKGHCQASA